jgi:hypothetical protein
MELKYTIAAIDTAILTGHSLHHLHRALALEYRIGVEHV